MAVNVGGSQGPLAPLACLLRHSRDAYRVLEPAGVTQQAGGFIRWGRGLPANAEHRQEQGGQEKERSPRQLGHIVLGEVIVQIGDGLEDDGGLQLPVPRHL